MKKCLFLLSLPIFAILIGCEQETSDPVEPETNDEVKYAFEVFNMNIAVANNSNIVSKDVYLKCTVKVNGNNTFPEYSGTAQIRGRGNSSWLWYDKNPTG
jgi:hypothetical protein